MLRLRTTSRGFLGGAIALCTAGALGLPAQAAVINQRSAAHSAGVPALVFPVVGPTSFHDDFGEPRSRWSHPGNDLVAAKRSKVLAVESGTVAMWTRSASAGCMLYLYGASGTMYEYIHLNNDLGTGNDNRGGCVAGVAWAPGLRDGDHVTAGQQIGFVGNSGDASGGPSHLHFEVHPGGGGAVSPYAWLVAAKAAADASPASSTQSMTRPGERIPGRASISSMKPESASRSGWSSAPYSLSERSQVWRRAGVVAGVAVSSHSSRQPPGRRTRSSSAQACAIRSGGTCWMTVQVQTRSNESSGNGISVAEPGRKSYAG